MGGRGRLLLVKGRELRGRGRATSDQRRELGVVVGVGVGGVGGGCVGRRSSVRGKVV